MGYKLLSALLFTIYTISLSAQNSIEKAIDSVKQNNKTIISAKQFVSAKSMEYNTGLTIENPSISADYMIGTPVSGGNQFDFLAVQGFDFPTAYSKKGTLAEEKITLLNFSFQEMQQNILLEVKLMAIEMIYLNKKKLVLEKRKINSEQIVDDYQAKFQVQEISALDLNKSKIQLLNIKSELRSIESEIIIKTQHLTELNGGIPLSIADTLYPIAIDVPQFEVLEDSIEANDPRLKWLHQQTNVYESQVDVDKAMALPKFEAGYHYQSVLGQTFNGVHLGLTIPLWQNKNMIKASEANVELGTAEVEEHELDHFFEVKELYEQYENLKLTLQEYQLVLENMNSEQLLKTSLDAEEISFITYSMELQYYYDTYDAYSKIELDYHLVLAKLYKYQLT